MKRLASVISMLATAVAFFACGDSHLVEDSDQPTLDQHIFVLPDRPSMRPPRASQGARVICNVRCFFLALLARSVPSGFGSACASYPRVGRSGFVFEPLR